MSKSLDFKLKNLRAIANFEIILELSAVAFRLKVSVKLSYISLCGLIFSIVTYY